MASLYRSPMSSQPKPPPSPRTQQNQQTGFPLTDQSFCPGFGSESRLIVARRDHYLIQIAAVVIEGVDVVVDGELIAGVVLIVGVVMESTLKSRSLPPLL